MFLLYLKNPFSNKGIQECVINCVLLPFLSFLSQKLQVRQFWEYTFNCRFDLPLEGRFEDEGALCTGEEHLERAATEYLDVSNLRPEYNIYKAVYALAHALDDLLRCVTGKGPFSGHSCATMEKLEPWQVCRLNFLSTFKNL